MEREKLDILESLHELLSHNVIGDKQYLNRYNGFTAELAFQDWFDLSRKDKLIDGGMFLPTVKSDNPFNEAIYFTSSESPPSKFLEIYTNASALASKGLFFIQYDISKERVTWENKPLFQSKEKGLLVEKLFPVPPFEVFEFDPTSKEFSICTMGDISSMFNQASPQNCLAKKPIPEDLKQHFISKFTQFSAKSLLKIYIERLFFDGYLNLTYVRGAPLDIDTFANGKEQGLCLLEIKEKDISKRDPKGFGMDLRRIESLIKLSEALKAKAFYVVRHVDNQTDRQFIDWRIITLEKFKEKISDSPIVKGGTGMRSESSDNPTKVCKYEYFQELK